MTMLCVKAEMAYGGRQIQLAISALDRDELLSSCSSHFTSGDKASSTN